MVAITTAKLQEITAAAIVVAKRELAAQKDAIFGSAMRQLKIEASAGRRYAVAMSLKSGVDYADDSVSKRTLSSKDLLGVGALLFEQCRVFEPTIEHWSREVSDGRGEDYTEQGFNIVLHWTDVDDLLAKVGSLGDEKTAAEIRTAVLAVQNDISEKAAGILGQFEARAVAAAKSGRSWAIAMSLKSGVDFTCPQGKRIAQIEEDWLGPVADQIWKACAKFAPTFEYWSNEKSDGRGESYTEEGINIVVHW